MISYPDVQLYIDGVWPPASDGRTILRFVAGFLFKYYQVEYEGSGREDRRLACSHSTLYTARQILRRGPPRAQS